ncbi:DUF2341 domain-containing protein, partial [Candidatus Woesebacteria bacterium]|nr:DUF2341 domain-containing protein [Candidatus Woesebacteria bacterium]
MIKTSITFPFPKFKKKFFLKCIRIIFSFWFVFSNFLFGFPIDDILNKPLLVSQVQATTATYDYNSCATTNTCDSDTGMNAYLDDVDVFPFAGATANRNSHTELTDSGYTNIGSSNNSYESSSDPGSGDEIFGWFEMTITQNVNSIRQIDFTYEGYPVSTDSNFSIWVKTAAGNYQDNASWTQVGATTLINASTDSTITGSLTQNISDYIDGNGMIVWGVYNVTGFQVINTDYVKMDVIYTPLDQEGFRFRNDDGSESSATWIDSQDTNITQAIETNTRLRMLVNANGNGDPDGNPYQIEYKLSTDDQYRIIENPGNLRTATPVVESRSSGATTAVNVTSHSITMPSGITAGDLLIIFFASDGNVDIRMDAGNWVKLEEGHSTTINSGAVFYKYAEGGDTGTVLTSAGEQSSHVVLRISGAGVPIGAADGGTGANSDPPNLDTGVSKNYLWIASRMGDSNITASAAPSGYSNLQTQAPAGTGGASTNTAEYSNTASSEDPGTFTSASEQWVGITVAVPPSGLGIEAVAAPAVGTTALSVPYPNHISTGDLLVLTVGNKTSASIPTAPVGWTENSNFQATGGIGVEGADSGTMVATVYTKIATGNETGFETVATSGTSSVGRMFVVNKEPGKVWDVAMANGNDNSADVTWNVTAGSNPGITAGDLIIVVSAINSDFSIYDAQTVSATGTTFQTLTDGEIYENGTTAGNDMELVASRHRVLTGTATAAPSYSMTSRSTTANSPTGASIFVRLRQIDAPIQLAYSSNIASSGEATTAQLSAPSGKTTGDFLAGRIQDDENPSDSIDISSTQYTELEWNLYATTTATNGQTYQFRVTINGGTFATYSVIPQWTIGSGSADVQQIHYRWRNDDGDEGTPGSAWYSANWLYRKKMDIDSTLVDGSTDLTNFPVLISLTDTDVQAAALSNGDDIVFTSADGTTKLDHEIENYNSSTGEMQIWVRIPTLGATSDTSIYVYYGNSGASNQESIANTWNTDYQLVWHLNEDPTGSAPQAEDSTTNTNDGTATGLTAGDLITAQIHKGISFADDNQYYTAPDDSSISGLSNLTFSLWVYDPSWPAFDYEFIGGKSNWSDNREYRFRIDQGNIVWTLSGDGSNTSDTSPVAASSLAESTWHYLVGTYNATTDDQIFYINGEEVDTLTFATSGLYDGSANFAIATSGNDGGSNVDDFSGDIDEVRVANIDHTPQWIKTEYNNQTKQGTGSGKFIKTLGSEEEYGTGASWSANEDTIITDVPLLTNYRLRFELSNEGGASSGAVTYQLEVAETSTCTSGSYSAVPTDSSGDWKIADSTYLTDGNPTTNVSGGLT